MPIGHAKPSLSLAVARRERVFFRDDRLAAAAAVGVRLIDLRRADGVAVVVEMFVRDADGVYARVGLYLALFLVVDAVGLALVFVFDKARPFVRRREYD